MKKRTVIPVAIMFLCTIVLPQTGPTGDQQTVDDGDKTSSKVSDMITSVEQAEKALDAFNKAQAIASGAKQTVDAAKNLKNVNLKEKALNSVTSTVVVYKNSKQSFMKIMDSVTAKVSNILDKASDRINMWRTTEPTLIAFGKGLKKMANNTVQVFKEFKPEDLIDIDRKWERKLEQQLSDSRDYVVGMVYYMTRDLSQDNRKTFISLFLDDGMRQEMTKTDLGIKATAAQLTVPIHRYRQIPSAAMQRAGEAIEACGTIVGQSHGNSSIDPSMSNEQADFKKIEETLSDGKQTYEDARELASLIAQKRQAIATQTTQLQQLMATMQADLARMYLNDVEVVAMQSESMGNTLKAISNGQQLETLDEQMKRQ